MKQLPGLDASFLHLETPQMPMHVGALHNFEMPAKYKGNFLEDMRRHMAARLVLTPALRQKLVKMPMNLSNPVWIDDEPDLEEHVVGITLPPGSGQKELERQIGLLHPVLLDRSRPLWKFHVFDGLANGADGTKRYAMYTQLHHAAVDGQAAVAVAQAILDTKAEGREVDQQRHGKVRREQGVADMLRGAFSNQLDLMMSAVKAIPGAVGVLSEMATQKAGSTTSDALAAFTSRFMGKPGQGSASNGKSASNLALAPRTRLNATISDTRAFASISLPLAAVNVARRRHGASLNDAVLMICSGALRRNFLKHGPLPRKSMLAGVPISTRAKGDTSSNNQATMAIVSLGTNIADPAKRLAHVLAATAAMKSNMGAMKSLMPTDFPSIGVPWIMQGLSSLYEKARVADRMPAIANVTISNLPGPTIPLYMAGARMLTNYPTSIVVHGVALNITVQTYDASLEFGLIACGEAMPEIGELAQHVQDAFDEFDAMPASVEGAAAVPASSPLAATKVVAERRAATKTVTKKIAATKTAEKETAPRKAASKKVTLHKAVAKKVVAKKAATTTKPASTRVAAKRAVAKATKPPRASAPSKRRAAS